MLGEDWYWYQYTENPSDSKYLLIKEDIIRVLRQDIQERLATAPKPKRQRQRQSDTEAADNKSGSSFQSLSQQHYQLIAHFV